MPVHPVEHAGRTIGFRWGKTGKLYRTRAAAEAQARAIYATGWRDDDGRPRQPTRGELHLALSPDRFAEARYRRALVGLLAGVHAGVLEMADRDILPAASTRHDAPERISSKARRLLTPAFSERIAKHLRPLVGVAFDLMARSVDKKNARGMTLIGIPIAKAAAKVDDEVAKARDANIRLVEDAGRDYADDVRDVFTDPDNEGLRVEDLRDKLLDRGNVSKSRAELIAVDQTLKLNAALTRARHQAVGIDKYRWSTSKDERVRPMHADLEGQVFGYDDPPVTNDQGDTNNPGEDYRCRCVPLPYVEEFEDEGSDDDSDR